MPEINWWKKAVGYQIYPRSFMDSNHDGIGDINGIRGKLWYLKTLGIDFIWLNPIYASPNVDNGYDISDYQEIHEDFGTMEDFKQFLEEAHALEIKVIMDLVINHTSDQHPWFIESRKSKDNSYRNYYHWVDATEDKLPNNWQSFFGGSTWTYDEQTQQAYFHTFAKEQPDLNWKNPKVRQEIYAMIRWWLELGIDGFRLDAISHIQKEPWDFKISDNPWAPFMNVSGIEEYMGELKTLFNEYQVMTVGEASGVSDKEAVNWTGDNGYFNMIFELEHTDRIGELGRQRGDILHLKKTLARWQTSLENQGWNALYLENHDTPRSVSVFGDGSARAAKALAAAFLLLKGTPFIYQGQELGMTNFPFHSVEEMDAKDTINYYQLLLEEGKSKQQALEIAANWSRDHSRTPFQWAASTYAGFSTALPWLKVNENSQKINVEQAIRDEASVFYFYQRLIRLRKEKQTLILGRFQLVLPEHPTVFAYLRSDSKEEWLIFTHLSDKTESCELPLDLLDKEWEEVIGTGGSKKVAELTTLSPYETHIYKRKK